MIKMKSLTVFQNHRIRTVRGDGVAQAGEEFETDADHAQSLRRSGMAVPVRAEDLDGAPAAATPLAAPFGNVAPETLAPVAPARAALASAPQPVPPQPAPSVQLDKAKKPA